MKTAIIVIVVVALAAVGVVVVTKKDDNKSNNETTSSTNQTGQEPVSSEGTEQHQEESATASSSVSIEDFSFKPAKITVKKGTKVTWTNKDSTKHTVTPDQAGSTFMGSELLAQNATYSVTFDTVGTFTYHCQPHPQMKGTVEVTE